jgi:DNA-binding NarL/FixJ family response regulator
MVESRETRAPLTRKRLAVIDDHPLVRRGLVTIITHEPDLEVCVEAATVKAGLEEIAAARPDLVTIDLLLRDRDGLELIRAIRQADPHLPVLVISTLEESIYAERAFRAGARGYVTKTEATDTVLVAVRRLLHGEQYISPKMSTWFAQQYLSGRASHGLSPMATLSDRELEIFRLLGQNQTRGEIARKLHLSVKTVESHRAHIKEKLNIRSGVELHERAVQWVRYGRDD